jgi:hypothetical protein
LKKVLGALGAIALMSTPGAAAAHTIHIPTTVQFVGETEGPAGNIGFYGFLATKKKCRANRTVKLVFHYSTGNEVVDVGRSSRSGNWGLSADPTGVDGAHVVVTKKNVGRHGHRHICNRDSAIPLDGA